MADTKANIGVREVQALNARISKLNTQRTEVATKISMYKSTLAEELKNYLDTFGVNLSGKTLGETKKLVLAEAERVNATIQEEYDLKKKVVELIEMGDIAEANHLLGIEDEPEVAEAEEEDSVQEETTVNSSDDFNVEDLDLSAEPEDTGEEDFGFSTDLEDQNDSEEETAEVTSEDSSDDEDYGFGFLSVADPEAASDEEEPEESSVTKGNDGFEDGDFSTDDLSVDEDFDEDDFGFGELLNGGNKF